jgi:hypothetical protein
MKIPMIQLEWNRIAALTFCAATWTMLAIAAARHFHPHH